MFGALPRDVIETRVIANQELLRRRQDDPLFEFEPFAIQKKFINAVLSGEPPENYYMGANRSGKSDAGAAAGSVLARFGNQSDDVPWVTGRGSRMSVRDRATSGWVSALDFPTSRDTIQPKYFDNGFVAPGVNHKPFIPKREIEEWRISDQVLKLKNGSIIGFKSSDSGRLKYQGADKDWVHLDEEHPKSIYEEIIIRVGPRPLKIFTTCTLLPPEGAVGGITWVYNDIVKPWKAGTLEGIEVFNASIYDNPHIPTTELVRLEARYPEGSTQRRIRLGGELIPGLAGSRVYTGFQPELNIRKQPEMSLRRPLAWIWDFNVEPMITLIGQRDRTLFRVFRELHLDEGDLGEMCELFRQIHPLHLAEIWIYGDATGKDRSHQTRRSSYQLIHNYMKGYPAPIKMKVSESNPAVPSRINAVNVACKNEEGMINLELDPTCVETISDMEQVLSDGRGGIKKTTNKKDPYFKRTHGSDALGYWITYEAPVMDVKRDARGGLRKRGVPRPGYAGMG
jgi:phage terminase large subunit-like protein